VGALGEVSEDVFLTRCIRCGQCIKACPQHLLHPSLLEGGIEGLLTPRAVMRTGFCASDCLACGEVCPTGAIERQDLGVFVAENRTALEKIRAGLGIRDLDRPTAEEQKKLVAILKRGYRIGTAFLDTTRCIPYVDHRNCTVCEEQCPIPTKAIQLHPTRMEHAPGEWRLVKLPRIEKERCIGCGKCEYHCPVQGQSAIRVRPVQLNQVPFRNDPFRDALKKPKAR
jgi:ferredoxin